ncbi:MAG: winged helix-turn-helix domain-containing protein [Flavobacterium sp.]|nr:winged helix-turn-helix domain-containing protein [Flavobacterium sp.]
MHLSRNFFTGKRKYLFGLMLISFVALICLAFSWEDGNGFDSDRREVILRRIGHELLLQSGDSTSRVLPIKKIAENEYQIAFEDNLTFRPDSLVNTTRRWLDKDAFTSDYIVKVLNCGNSRVAYGYVVSKNRKDDIIACIGRRQPKACYMVNVTFKPTGIDTAKNVYLMGSLSFLAVIGFVFLRSGKPQSALPDGRYNNMIALGLGLFDAQHRKLIINGTTIDLTGTESRLMLIFALSPNVTIDRSRLQKEIWEDEGVVVGRSLDMFISKLRKKLEFDPNIKIVVVRGKGYKLQIGA